MKPICIILFIFLLGCNNDPLPVTNTADVITKKYQAKEDSLNNIIASLQKQVDLYKTDYVQNQPVYEHKKEKVKQTIQQSITVAKENNCDTTELVNIKTDYDQYVSVTDHQLETQGIVIQKQDSIITNLTSSNELQKTKFKELKEQDELKDVKLATTEKDLAKTKRKLKRSKFFNKVFGIGTAAGAALAAFIFL